MIIPSKFNGFHEGVRRCFGGSIGGGTSNAPLTGADYNRRLQAGESSQDIRNSTRGLFGSGMSDANWGAMVQNAGMNSPTGRPMAGSDQFFQPVYNTSYQNYAQPNTQANVSMYGTQPPSSSQPPQGGFGGGFGGFGGQQGGFGGGMGGGYGGFGGFGGGYGGGFGGYGGGMGGYGGGFGGGIGQPQVMPPQGGLGGQQGGIGQPPYATNDIAAGMAAGLMTMPNYANSGSPIGGSGSTQPFGQTMRQLGMGGGQVGFGGGIGQPQVQPPQGGQMPPNMGQLGMPPAQQFNQQGGFAGVGALPPGDENFGGGNMPFMGVPLQRLPSYAPSTPHQDYGPQQGGMFQMQSPFSYQPQQQSYQQQSYQPSYQQPAPPVPQRTSSGPSQAIVGRSSQMRGTPNVMRRAEGGITSLMDDVA